MVEMRGRFFEVGILGPLVEKLLVEVAVAVGVEVVDGPVHRPVSIPVGDIEVAVQVALAGGVHVPVLVDDLDNDGAPGAGMTAVRVDEIEGVDAAVAVRVDPDFLAGPVLQDLRDDGGVHLRLGTHHLLEEFVVRLRPKRQGQGEARGSKQE